MRAVLFAILLGASTGCAQVIEADLAPPMRLWDHERAGCGRTRAIDGNGDVWVDGGCNNGFARFTKSRHATDDERKRVEAAFQALPKADPDQMARDCKGDAHFFVERFADDKRSWRLCGDLSAPLGDPKGLPDSFAAAARAFPP